MPRVIDEPHNLILILENREDAPIHSGPEAIQPWLEDGYNMHVSKRRITAALRILRSGKNRLTKAKIREQYAASPFASNVSINELLQTELYWIESGEASQLVAEVLGELGYTHRHWESGNRWIKKPSA